MHAPRILRWEVAFAAMLIVYVVSYIAWTRVRMAQLRAWNSEGYYFLSLAGDADERCELAIRVLYFPCIWIDVNMIGGKSPAAAPLRYPELSNGS